MSEGGSFTPVPVLTGALEYPLKTKVDTVQEDKNRLEGARGKVGNFVLKVGTPGEKQNEIFSP